MTLLVNAGYPTKMRVFTDEGSVAHVALGFLSGLLPPVESVAASTAFAGYQLSQAASGEQWERTGGEFLEFAIGILLAALVKGTAKL